MKPFLARHKLLAGLATTLIGVLVCALTAELILRWQCTFCSWSEKNEGQYVSPYKVFPWHSWYHVRGPNETTKYTQPEFNYELKTNSLGLRDIEHPVEKEENEFRILGLGDSFMEGVGVEDEDSYLKVLERNLNNKHLGVKVRVINAGVSGSDPIYGYKLLEDKLLKFKPDLVIVAVTTSDVEDIIARGGEERFLDNGKVKFADPPRSEWLFASSHLYRLIAIAGLGYDWFGLSPAEQIVKRRQAVESIEKVLGKFHALSVKENFRLLTVLHPCSWQEILYKRYYSLDERQLKRYMEQKGIDYVDIMASFTKKVKLEEKELKKLFWERDGHYNAAGYRIFAAGIEEYLNDKRLIKSRRLKGDND